LKAFSGADEFSAHLYISPADLCKSAGEIYKWVEEIYKSAREIHISPADLCIFPSDLCISRRESGAPERPSPSGSSMLRRCRATIHRFNG